MTCLIVDWSLIMRVIAQRTNALEDEVQKRLTVTLPANTRNRAGMLVKNPSILVGNKQTPEQEIAEYADFYAKTLADSLRIPVSSVTVKLEDVS